MHISMIQLVVLHERFFQTISVMKSTDFSDEIATDFSDEIATDFSDEIATD